MLRNPAVADGAEFVKINRTLCEDDDHRRNAR
jgi:hypothetical protein